MKEMFLKSALPAQGLLVLDDTSLALPAEPNVGSPTKPGSTRRLRLHQQVQLSLARKSRKSQSNGGVQLEQIKAKSFDTTDVPSPYMKVNRIDFTKRSLSSNHVWRPSLRVEVSPTASPELPRSRFNFSTPRHGGSWVHTMPEPVQSHSMGIVPDQSLGYDTYRRYAFSEVPRGTQRQASTFKYRSNCQKSLRQTAGPQPVFANPAFERSGVYGSPWSQNQTAVEQEKHTAQQKNDMVLGAVETDEGRSLFAQLRRAGLGVQKMNSNTPSVASLEMARGRQVDVHLPNQQTRAQNVTTLKSKNKSPEMTVERAVKLLTQDNEESLILAASYLQNQCFKSEDAKKRVYDLGGIGKLLKLLHSNNEEVQRYAAGALRNVVFKSSKNKMEVKDNDGFTIILDALKCNRDVETRRQLCGLLWNLSSHDLLKECFTKENLSVLTQSVLVPSSGINEGENPKSELLADATVFYNATGCLRNVSCAGPNVRNAMRNCENLIDSLVYYMRLTIADHKTNDKSTENCICILHNLSYMIEADLPKKYTQDLRESQQNVALKPKSVGCFSFYSAKITEDLEGQSPLLEEKANPRGIEWLWSNITIRMYISLIVCSSHHETQAAAIGALQNMTAGNGAMSEAIAFTIVKQENGLKCIKTILKEGESIVKKMAIFLIKNLSRYEELHSDIVNQLLPEVVQMLPSDNTSTVLPPEVTASLCFILNNLSQGDSEHIRAIINQNAIPKIIRMSSKGNGIVPTRTSQAASFLLYTWWSHSNLRKDYKRCGYFKKDFINARTVKAVNSGQN